MKRYFLAAAVLGTALLMPQASQAQCETGGSCSGGGQMMGGSGEYGMTQPVCTDKRLGGSLFAFHDRYSPYPHYAYGRNGVRASWEHSWNQNRAQITPWHGGHQYWRFGTPTALVVPPTAAFQTSYAWGVGQTRSMPINHQFGKAQGFGSGPGTGFAPTPYWPSNTEQFGVYAVRGPWN